MLKFIFSTQIILFLISSTYGQQIGNTQFTFTDSFRSNRNIPVEIYYPSLTAGNNSVIAQGPFPLIVFGHGFVMDWSAYQNFWDSLVPENYILVFPKTETGLSPVHQDLADDLKFIISFMKINGAGPFIPPSSIGLSSAIMGHSMGGGSCFLAAANNTTLTTIVTFAAANTNPSSINAAVNVTIPSLIFSGTNDCVAPPLQHQDLMYDSCGSQLKTQIYVSGGGHCYFADNNLFCSIGEGTCSPSPTIGREEQQNTVNSFLKMWLAFFLKGECIKAMEFQDSLLISNRITFRQNQALSCATFVNQFSDLSPVIIYPNPASDFIRIRTSGFDFSSIEISNTSTKLFSAPVKMFSDDLCQLDISGLETGIYILTINNTIRKLLVKQ